MDSSILSNSPLRSLTEPARRTRDAVERLSEEFATRRVSDLGGALRHDFTALAVAEREMGLADALKHSVEAGRRLTARAGESLDRIALSLDGLRNAAQPSLTGSVYADPEVVRTEAESALRNAITALNVTSDGRSVFAGGRVDADATAPIESVLADVRGLATQAGVTDMASLQAAVDAYFDPTPVPGNFADGVPDAANQPASIQLRVGEDETVSYAPSPLGEDVLTILKAVSMAVASTQSGFAAPTEARDFAAVELPVLLSGASDAAIRERARTGTLEGRLDRALEEVDAARLGAERERDALIGADPYETGTRLQDEAARLESIYTLTARLSRLRLTDYL